jgi:hypothetical protein
MELARLGHLCQTKGLVSTGFVKKMVKMKNKA